MSFLDKYKTKEDEEEEFSFLNKYKFQADVGVGTKATGTLDIPMPEIEEKPLTKLHPREEYRFQQTYKKMATKMGLSLDPDDPEHQYDWRALYKEDSTLTPNAEGHFSSKYKLEGHKNMYIDGVKTKEPTPAPGVSQRMRGIGEPPKEFELEAPLAKLPETGKKIIQMLGGLQGFKATEPETYKQINDISKVINEQPDKLSKIAKAHELLTGESIEQSLKEMGEPTLQPWEKTGLTYKIGVGGIEFVKLPKKFDEAQGLVQQAMQFSTSGKVGDVMRTIAQDVVLGYLVTVGLKGLYQSGLRVGDKWVSGKKLEEAMARAQKAYITETGKFKATLSNNDLTVVKAVQRIVRSSGVKAGEIAGVKVPQLGFLGQAGGVPNIVKMIQQGGITPEVTSQLKTLSTVEAIQTYQQLLNLSPALASEFLKAVEKPKVPEVYKGKAYRAETHISEHGADIIAKMDTAQQKLDYDASTTGNPIFKEAGDLAENIGIDLSKVPVTEMIWVAPDIKTAEKYGEAEEYKLPEDTIVLAKDEEGGSLVLKNSEKYIEEPKFEPSVAEKIVQDPAPTEPKVKPEEPKIDLATPVQIRKAHAIANTKAMISEKGKVKPQYRAVAKGMTGKTSVKDMTPEEAEMFIDALDRLPEPKYKDGKLVAPTIPRTMKLTVEGFFQKKYGEPTPIWLLTDQTYYATKLGIKPLVEPFERGKMEFDLEFRKSSNLVDRMVNKLNDIAKTSAFAKIKSKVKNIPTKAESEMAELVNKYETTPPGLSEKEEDVFKYFRNLSKDIWRRENEVREKVDLPPIKYKQAYFRHTADVMAKEMLEGKYPFPQGIKYWGEKTVGKKIFNPMEFHRKLSDDLIDLWSKDIRAVTKAMLWSGLKEIYLAQPAKFLNEQLNAISKDLPEYKNLSPRDQAAYDQTRVMPASTKKWLVNYVNQVLKGQETELDASLNRIVTKSGLKGIFDKVLSPFGRSIGRKPITNVFVLGGRAIISGVMGWVPRQITRNSFQPVQNLALYGVKATIKAYLPASVDKNLKELMSESLFRKSYTGFEELPTNLMAKLEKVWLGPYGIVAVNNAKLGMKAAYWNISELIKNPKFKKHGWADPQRTKDTPKGFLYPSEKEKLLKEMEFGASATQYQYIPMGMPGVFRYKALVPLTRLQSWWMNYFTKFTREALHRAFKGRPSWSGEDGPTLPWSRRVNYLKYLIIGGAILTSLGYRRSFLLGVLPVYMSPAMQVALGMYNYATATEDWQKKRALKQIYYSWKAFIPGSLAWRDFLAVWKGEKELNEILFYGKKEEKKKEPVSPYLKKYKLETKPTKSSYLKKYKR